MLCTHKTASSASLVLEICPQFNNSYLNQFSSISGGNCISSDRCVHCRDHGDNIVVHPSLDLEVVLVIDPIQRVEAHCRDHGDNIVVHSSLDLEVVLVIDPIQRVEALIEDIFVLFRWPTSPGSCSTTDGNIHCPCT